MIYHHAWKIMGGMVILLLCVAILTSFAEQTLYVNNTQVNIRSNPTSQTQNILTTLPRGTSLIMLGQEGTWYKVRLPDGRIGWISAWVVTTPDMSGQTPSSVPGMPSVPQTGMSRSGPVSHHSDQMIFIPGGMAVIGSHENEVRQLVNSGSVSHEALQDELPQRTISMRGFYIDQYEVSNVQYKKFVDETRYPPPLHWEDGMYSENTGNHPVTYVSWNDASAYASWAGKRLPTAEEWEFAARGVNGHRFPWGNAPFSNQANLGKPSGRVAPAGASPADVSPYNIYDMGGNVMEWTMSQYGNAKDFFVLKGGSWLRKPYQARGANRTPGDTQYRLSDIGFRCAKSEGRE